MGGSSPIPQLRTLETKLDPYEALSGDDATAGKNRQRRWARYATAAGSSLALTTSAEAGIMYSGVQNLTATVRGNSGGATFQLDIDIQGHTFSGHVQRTSSVQQNHGIA
jgi:hypothetical protein